jgi:hypothetical protein
LTGFHISLPFSCGVGGVSVASGAGSVVSGVAFSYVEAGFSRNVTCFFALIIFAAASFALAGVVSSTCLAKMVSSVSRSSISVLSAASALFSSSSESRIHVGAVRVSYTTLFLVTLLTCSCCKNCEHFDRPSISSISFSLFLVLST